MHFLPPILRISFVRLPVAFREYYMLFDDINSVANRNVFRSQAVAVACLFLASKVEEKPLKLSDHIFMYFRLRKNKILKRTDQV